MTDAPRWVAQDRFDSTVYAVASRYGVAPALIKAVIATESGFNPQAYRAEAPRPSLPPTPDFPAGGDASFGLMQVLSRTARALGFTGTVQGLFDPSTNIDLGTRLLRDNLRQTNGIIADSLSAYNGGFRPSLGYGSPLPTGKYANQSYVDAVTRNYDYFRMWEAAKGGTADAVPFPESGPGSSGALDRPPVAESPRMRFPFLAVSGGVLGWIILTGLYWLTCRG